MHQLIRPGQGKSFSALHRTLQKEITQDKNYWVMLFEKELRERLVKKKERHG